jgi:hypothetical protein
MSKLEFNIGAVPKAKSEEHVDYQYPKGKKKPTKCFTLTPLNAEKVKRMTHWNNFDSESELLNAILDKFFEDKDFMPIPPKNKISI